MPVGFVPSDGETVSWVFPGGQFAGTTFFRNTGDVFPNTPELFDQRYGPAFTLPGEGSVVRASFPVYAETIGLLSVAMERASQDPANPWGFTEGVPTILEVYDFAATRIGSGGWSGSVIKRRYFDQPTTPTKPSTDPRDLEILELKGKLNESIADAGKLRVELDKTRTERNTAVAWQARITRSAKNLKDQFPVRGGGIHVQNAKKLVAEILGE